MALNVLLLGPQGAGKGTQAQRVSAEYGIPHIASGEILRAEMAAGTELGHRVKDAATGALSLRSRSRTRSPSSG